MTPSNEMSKGAFFKCKSVRFGQNGHRLHGQLRLRVGVSISAINTFDIDSQRKGVVKRHLKTPAFILPLPFNQVRHFGPVEKSRIW